MAHDTIFVKDVFRTRGTHCIIVDEEEPFKEIITLFTRKSHYRDIFVVNKRKKLIGIISRSDLLNWARFKLGIGTEGHTPSIDEIQRFVFSTTAKDVMNKETHNIHVSPEDSIITAMDIMVSSDLIDIPVIDKEGKILGDITLTEIMLHLL